jgi:sodium-dependent dicarboxylate transporter 2/3/5
MLPVATPPNALAYGTGIINQRQMLRAGLILNIFGIIVIFTAVSLFA